MKRRRYRQNKKRKYFQQQQCLSSSNTCSAEVAIPSCPNSEDGSNDSNSVHPYEWKIFKDQAERFRQMQAMKKAKLDEKFGTFVDQSPSFPKDNRNIILPDCLSGIDRVEVSHQMKEMLQNENEALSQARFYRDKCESLEQRIRRLHTEKEGIRYFWRNKVLEGHSRAGQILKNALSPSQ